MKNRKVSIALLTGIVSTLGLTACGSNFFAKENALVTYKDYSGNEVTVLTNSIYDKYKTSSDGISKYYNAILESIIRYNFDSSSKTIYKKSKDQIITEAKNNVEGDKATAKSNAKTNNTSYDKEWESILSSHGCKDENELYEYYVFQIEKSEMQDYYYNAKKGSLLNEYIGIDKEGKRVATAGNVPISSPYHIRHILAKVANGASDYTRSTISKEEAKNLGQIMDYLIDKNYEFGEVAKKFKDQGDTGSAEKGGDVGIMDLTTSFVNEFKLGIYVYDNIITNSSKSDDVQVSLGLKEKTSENTYADRTVRLTNPTTFEEEEKSINEFFTANGLTKVPYGAFTIMKDVYDQETANKKGENPEKVDDTKILPRNVIFNEYLNHHDIFVITNQDLVFDESSHDYKLKDMTQADHENRFTADGANGYLTDEKGRIIIGVRSQHGIHFMIIQKSINNFNSGTEDIASLDEYYTTYTPDDPNFPKKADGSDKETYVNYIKTDDTSVYITRANEIKTKVKSFDSTYEYRLYNYLSENGSIQFKDPTLKTNIDNYIKTTQRSNIINADKSLNDSWKAYIEQLQQQKVSRSTTGRLIPTRCAANFEKHDVDDPDWIKGGACYYGK